MNSVYQINRGINKPIEFRGLKAQYIGYLAGGLVILLILFAILYICGVSVYVCLAIAGTAGTSLFRLVYKYSHKYGQYGVMKKAARKAMPGYIRLHSRKVFTGLYHKSI